MVLARPGHAFDQDVPARQQGHDQALQQVILPDDDLLHLVQHALHRQSFLGIHTWSIGYLLKGNIANSGEKLCV